MKPIALIALLAVAACASPDAELLAHLKAERDFHSHQAYLESIYAQEERLTD